MTRIASYFFILFLSLSTFSIAQKEQEIPKKIQKSIPDLAVYLTKNESSEVDKVERIYEWITNNIEYDYDKLTSTKTFVGVDPAKILKAKKGICTDYVELMYALLKEIGIKSETVPGYIHDSHWQAGDTLFEESHSWIAIEIDEEWFLADPTWDAGYIGQIPIKPFKAKTFDEKKYKDAAKAEKAKKKFDDKEAKRKEAYDKKPQYTDSYGFVKDPQKDYFLIHSDTFLLSHLPTNPIWQLRKDPISIEDFSNEDSVIVMKIEEKGPNSYDSKMGLMEYQELDYLQKLLVLGEEGNKFNPKNPTIKALYYYNFLALITEKDLQKIARGSQYEITPAKYPALAALNDTLIKYIALDKKFQKVVYKENKEFDAADFKKSKERDKVNQKIIGPLEKKGEKFGNDLKAEADKLPGYLEKLASINAKIQENYPSASNYKKPEKLELKVIQKWLDSMQVQQDLIKNRKEELMRLRSNSSMNRYVNNIGYLDYLYDFNSNVIPNNNYSTSSIIGKVDSLIAVEGLEATKIITDSMELELFDKALVDAVKKMESLLKAAKSEFKTMEDAGQMKMAIQYETYLASLLDEQIKTVNQLVLNSRNFYPSIEKANNQMQGLLKTIVKKKDKQVELKQSKYDFNLELTEAHKERGDHMNELLTKMSKEWKNKYKTKK